MQSVVNPISSSTSDKIRYIRTIRVRFTSSESFFRTLILRIEADASLGGRYCLPDSITSISFSNPETSSRVTLATLGIVFQTKLVVAHQGKA